MVRLTDAGNDNSSRSRPARWMRRLTRALFVVLPIGVWILWTWKEPTRLEISPETTHVVGPLTEDGRVDFVDAINQTLEKCPAEENAFALLYQIVDWSEDADTQELGRRLAEELGLDVEEHAPRPVIIPYETYIKTLNDEMHDAGIPQELPAGVMSEPWSPDQYPHLSKWLDQVEPALSVARKAADRPGFYRPIVLGTDGLLINVLLTDCQAYRVLVRALCARAMLRCETGDVTGAVDDLLVAYQIGIWSGEYPWMIAQLVQFSVFFVTNQAAYGLMNSGKLSSELAAEIQSQVIRYDFAPVAELMDGPQRLLILQSFLEKHYYRESPIQGLASRLGRGGLDWNVILKEINYFYDEASRISQIRDPNAFSRENSRFHREIVSKANNATWKMVVEGAISGREGVSRRVGEGFGALTLPKFDTSVRLRRRQLMERRLAVLALGLLRYCLENGEFPTTLDELPAEYRLATKDELADHPVEYRVDDGQAHLRSENVNGQTVEGESESYFAPFEVNIFSPTQDGQRRDEGQLSEKIPTGVPD